MNDSQTSSAEPGSPPYALSSFTDAAKIFGVVLIVIAVQTAEKAFATISDLSHISDAGFLLHALKVSFLGLELGLIDGFLRACQILMIFVAGPTLWSYIGPILAAPIAAVVKAASSIRQAWRNRHA